MTKVLRADDDVAEWAVEYAKGRGVKTAVIVSAALRSFRADCEGGVPELSESAASVRPARSVPPVGPAAHNLADGVARAEAFRRMTGRRS